MTGHPPRADKDKRDAGFWRRYAMEAILFLILGAYAFAGGAYAWSNMVGEKKVGKETFRETVKRLDTGLVAIKEDTNYLRDKLDELIARRPLP